MLLGISLVVQELHKGPRLLYRYPNESSNYYQQLIRRSDGISGAGKLSTNQKSISAENLLQSIYKQYFSLRYQFSMLREMSYLFT
jgi:hypothetical protein